MTVAKAMAHLLFWYHLWWLSLICL